MKLAEAKADILKKMREDLGHSYQERVEEHPADLKDKGKFKLDGRVVRVIAPFSGYFANVNPAWFDGGDGQPSINREDFDLYAFYLREKSGYSASYGMVNHSQMRVWVQEFISEHGTEHTNHLDWRCDFHRIGERKAVFRWGDEPLPTAQDDPGSRVVLLRAPGGPHVSTSADDLAWEEKANNDPARWQKIVQRIRAGQPAFRKTLLATYLNRCAISGHGPPAVLEAAHIEPHHVAGVNVSTNGLLLRADLHSLFDDGLLAINPNNFEIWVAPSLRGTPYWEFDGVVLRPRADGRAPSLDRLEAHWRAARKQHASTLP